MTERGAKKGGSLRKRYAQQRSLAQLYVHPNAALLCLCAECQELKKLSVDVYKWDEEIVCPVKNVKISRDESKTPDS